MAKITLTTGEFTPISQGEHIFKIVNSMYDEDFGKLEIELITSSGQKHTERYSLINKDGEINEKAQNAFSYFAKTALNNYNLEEIDHEDIVGCYIQATVNHKVVPSNKDPAKNITFIELTDRKAVSGFDTDGEPVQISTQKLKPKSTTVNLDDLLG